MSWARCAVGGACTLGLVACGGLPPGEVLSDGARAARVVPVEHVRDPRGAGQGSFARTLALAPETLAVMETAGEPPHAHVYGPAGSRWVHEAVLAPPAGAAWSGWAVAAGPGLVAIPGNAADGAGAVFVFERGVAGWALARTLVGPPGTTSFGGSVAMNGSRLLVGGYTADRGSVWWYERRTGDWSLRGELANPWSQPGEGWGMSVALGARGAVVMEEGPGTTGVHAAIYDDVGGDLVPVAEVAEELPEVHGGVRVALWGARMAFALRGGPVHLWSVGDGGATEDAELPPVDGITDFGHDVAAGDGFVAVSAPETPGLSGPYVGAAWVYVQTAAGWSAPIALSSGEETGPGEGFGHCLAASGDLLAIGVPRAEDADEEEDAGAAFLYQVRIPAAR